MDLSAVNTKETPAIKKQCYKCKLKQLRERTELQGRSKENMLENFPTFPLMSHERIFLVRVILTYLKANE
ncbi:unnamed protein product [Nezara viridula]|uniref:Uncharacterized protein n=1 Tax=Nezara viridula TaxID=85310 RepID=A0A9P0EEC0_NEZVI|nr:unnamed protein product [Nezara viridula]